MSETGRDRVLDGLPLDWVRAFEAAARLGSFTAAALETGLTQAAISQRIANLEGRLGARLFIRQARGVALTVEAEAWLPHATRALSLLHHSAQDIFGTRAQRLTVLASASVTRGWLVPRLNALEDRARLHLSFETLMVEADSDAGRGRVVARYGTGHWPGLRAARLFVEELAPVAAPELLNGVEDWTALPRIAVTGPRAGWSDWGGASVTAPLRFDSMIAAQAAAEAGAGVLLASLPLCAVALNAGRLVQIGTRSLTPASSYWLTAQGEDISDRRWRALCTAFCKG
ncbi:LysR family transcriptional regulator [Rhodobacteraceae bacterium KMM 6894]|nr:LysR family transcriptional regulator [Rhodobacteraceae bacterium KMM 6894]